MTGPDQPLQAVGDDAAAPSRPYQRGDTIEFVASKMVGNVTRADGPQLQVAAADGERYDVTPHEIRLLIAATPDEEPSSGKVSGPVRKRRPRAKGEPHTPGVTEKRTRRRRHHDDAEQPSVRRIIGGGDDGVVAPAPLPAGPPAGVPSTPPGDEPEDLGESRSGALWTEWDYRRIEWGIVVGRSRDQMGAMIGRTAGAVESRMAAVLATSGHNDGTGSAPFGKLWDLHRAGRLDLVGLAMAYHHAERIPLWTERVDGVLAAAWDEAAPSLTVLADTLELPEWRIVRRLMEMDRAADTREAVEHLGTDNPTGVIAVRARMSRDAAAAIVQVLVVTDADGQVLHLSLHPTDQDAVQALTGLATDMAAAVGHVELEEPDDEDQEPAPAPARWAIATRRVGEGSVRAVRTGTFVDGAVVDDAVVDDQEEGEPACL